MIYLVLNTIFYFVFNSKNRKFIKKGFWFLVILIAYPIYFAFAIKIKKPFDFPPNVNSSTLLKDYIFSNNTGMILLKLEQFYDENKTEDFV